MEAHSPNMPSGLHMPLSLRIQYMLSACLEVLAHSLHYFPTYQYCVPFRLSLLWYQMH